MYKKDASLEDQKICALGQAPSVDIYFHDVIYVPNEVIFAERMTMLNLALSARSLWPEINAQTLGVIIETSFRFSDSTVVDFDGIAFDLERIEAPAIFNDALRDGWIDAFLIGRISAANSIAITRLKLVWIAIALHDRQRSIDLLH